METPSLQACRKTSGRSNLIADDRASYICAGGRAACGSTSLDNCCVTLLIGKQCCFVFSKTPHSLSLAHFFIFNRKRQRICAKMERRLAQIEESVARYLSQLDIGSIGGKDR